jgi:hypothetical protein
LVAVGVAPVGAQNMPDPSLINGKAIPANELATGTVTVRVVREAIGNNIPGQQVKLTVAGATRTATTDEQGRAEFGSLPPGAQGVAETSVDGEALKSDPFTVPASGGLRVIMVSGLAKAAERKKAEEARELAAPPTKGVVVLGGNSRIITEFQNDNLEVFYLLDIVNGARTRVDIGGPIIVDLPAGAGGARTMEGSSPSATVNGSRLTVLGPFAPGTTSVQIGYQLRYNSPDIALAQKFPVAAQSLTVGIQKAGDMKMSSPQFKATRELTTDDGMVYLVGDASGLPANGTLAISVSNLPLHSRVPRYAALAAAAAIILAGVWLMVGTRGQDQEALRTLTARRDTLLGDLEQLELKRRAGNVAEERYNSRRQRLVTELEQIYGELDHAGGPQGGGEGVAA